MFHLASVPCHSQAVLPRSHPLPCAGVNSIYANMVRWKDHVRKPTAEEDAMVQAIAMVRDGDGSLEKCEL